jgi:hypothetical protein
LHRQQFRQTLAAHQALVYNAERQFRIKRSYLFYLAYLTRLDHAADKMRPPDPIIDIILEASCGNQSLPDPH